MTDPKIACMMDAVTTILQASELFEEVTTDFTFGCWRIEAIPRLKIPENEPSGDSATGGGD